MCYSGTCIYEDSMGNCRVKSTEVYRNEIGYEPCVIGGFAGVSENEYLDTKQQEKLLKKAKQKNLIW